MDDLNPNTIERVDQTTNNYAKSESEIEN